MENRIEKKSLIYPNLSDLDRSTCMNVLNTTQVQYLKLLITNHSRREITNYLGLKTHHITYLKLGITSKFGESDWTNIIRRSLELGILKHQDYVPNEVKRLSLFFSEKIIDSHYNAENHMGIITKKNEPINDSKSFIVGKKEMKLFLSICYYSFTKEQLKGTIKLSQQELNFIEFKHLGLELKNIRVLLKLSEKEVRNLSANILKKFKANNWFNVIRKALHLNILDGKTQGALNNDYITSKIIKNIDEILNHEEENIKEKQMNIYEELIEYFSILEYGLIFNGGYRPKKNITNVKENYIVIEHDHSRIKQEIKRNINLQSSYNNMRPVITSH